MKTKMRKLALVIGPLVMTGGAMADFSGSATMGVSAAIVNECSVGNINPMTFGDLAMLEAGAQSSAFSYSTGGTFDVICTNNPANTPKLRFTSANTEGNNFRLKGADPSYYIEYRLLTNTAGSINHGTDVEFAGLTANGFVSNLFVRGLIQPSFRSGKKVQTYSDTLTIQSSYNLP